MEGYKWCLNPANSKKQDADNMFDLGTKSILVGGHTLYEKLDIWGWGMQLLPMVISER